MEKQLDTSPILLTPDPQDKIRKGLREEGFIPTISTPALAIPTAHPTDEASRLIKSDGRYVQSFQPKQNSFKTLENFFYLQHEVNHILVNKFTFARYSEADEIYHRIMKSKSQMKKQERSGMIYYKG